MNGKQAAKVTDVDDIEGIHNLITTTSQAYNTLANCGLSNFNTDMKALRATFLKLLPQGIVTAKGYYAEMNLRKLLQIARLDLNSMEQNAMDQKNWQI